MSKLLERWNKTLLERYPAIWLSRLHYIVILAIPTFILASWAGRHMELSTSQVNRVALPLGVFALPVVLWIRFQYLNYQSYFQARGLYRLFLCNTLASLIIFGLILSTTFLVGTRINTLTGTRDLDKDLSTLRFYAYYLDSAYSARRAGSKDTAVLSAEKAYQAYRDTANMVLKATAREWPAYDRVRTMAGPIAQLYGIDLFDPENRASLPITTYFGNLAAIESDLSTQYNDVVLLMMCSVFCIGLAMTLAAFILNILLNKQLLSFVSPFVFLVVAVITLLNIELVLLLLVWIAVFRFGRRYVRTPWKTLAIQQVSYGLTFLSIMFPIALFWATLFEYRSNKAFVSHPVLTTAVLVRVICSLVVACGLSLLTIFYYCKWYLRYSLQPRRQL